MPPPRYNRPDTDETEPPYGFDAIAEILEARIGVEKLKGTARTKAARALAYPMASVEQAGAREVG